MSGVDGPRLWKIALVSPYDFAYPGGVTEHVTNLARQYRRIGYDAHVIAPSSADPDDVDSPPWLHRIGRVVPIPASGSVARITLSLRGYLQVKALLERERFDLIHLHEPLMPALPLTVLRHSHSINIGTFHAYRNSNLMYFYGKPVLKPFIRKLHGLIAVSRAARAFVADYFPGEYEILPNGIDYDHFSGPHARLAELDDGKLNVLFVGRLEKRKGLKYLLRAWPEVRAAVSGVRLVVVGDGRALAGYREWTTRQGLDDIVFTGHVPREDLPRFYHSCDVFCVPSTGDESFGVVLLEAMAAGKPIVTTDIPGYREVLSSGQEGLMVPAKDSEALAATLIHLLDHPGLRRLMGWAGAQTARRYSWDRVAAQVLEYYGRVVEWQQSGAAVSVGRRGSRIAATAEVARTTVR